MELGRSLYDDRGQSSSTYDSMYSCADCGKLYMHKRTLKRHELVHTATSCLTCLVCGKQYSQQYDFERHCRSHRGEKPFKCYVCGRLFAMSHHLSNHMVTHTGIRAYSCLVCSKRFAHTFSLKRHMRMHLRAAESVCTDVSADAGHDFALSGMALLQSLSCRICRKVFGSQQTLKRHRCQIDGACAGRPLAPAGLGFGSRAVRRCRECGIEFTTVRQLTDHAAAAHPGRPSKPYACTDCDKSFAHPYSLKRHRVEHGGEAHVCTSCGKRFAQLYELSRHVKSHRVDQPIDATTYSQPIGLTSNYERRQADNLQCPPAGVSTLPSEPANCLSMQIAKYMALQQDAQGGLASHLMRRDAPLPKPNEVCLLAFAQSLVVTSASQSHPPAHSLTAVTE